MDQFISWLVVDSTIPRNSCLEESDGSTVPVLIHHHALTVSCHQVTARCSDRDTEYMPSSRKVSGERVVFSSKKMTTQNGFLSKMVIHSKENPFAFQSCQVMYNFES